MRQGDAKRCDSMPDAGEWFGLCRCSLVWSFDHFSGPDSSCMPSLSLCCMYSVKWPPDLCLNLSRSAKAQCWWDPGQAEERRGRCWTEGSLAVSRPFCREVNGCASSGEAVQMSAMPSEQTDFLVGNKSSGHHVRSRRWHPRSAAAWVTGVTGALHRGLEASLQHAKRS